MIAQGFDLRRSPFHNITMIQIRKTLPLTVTVTLCVSFEVVVKITQSVTFLSLI